MPKIRSAPCLESIEIPKVLVVDDQNDNLVLTSLAVQDMGFRVVTAVNGEDAVAVALLARPQLILMDIAIRNLTNLVL